VNYDDVFLRAILEHPDDPVTRLAYADWLEERGDPRGELPRIELRLRTTCFVRQPQTAREIERACRAVEVCCVADVRYGGTDPRALSRLGNDPLYCDHLLTASSARLVPAPPRAPWGTTGG
jgi:uncharacterized protein (TIGR02996 family)